MSRPGNSDEKHSLTDLEFGDTSEVSGIEPSRQQAVAGVSREALAEGSVYTALPYGGQSKPWVGIESSVSVEGGTV